MVSWERRDIRRLLVFGEGGEKEGGGGVWMGCGKTRAVIWFFGDGGLYYEVHCHL